MLVLKRFFLQILAVTIISALIFSACHKEQHTIAIVSSLTGSLAANGKDMANGAKLALDEAISLDTNNLCNINYIMFDDQSDPKAAVSVANRICQDQSIIAVIGHLSSGCMSAAASVYSENRTPVVMPVPTNPAITKQGYNNLFRVPPTDDEQAPFLAEYLLNRDSNTKVAVVNDQTAYGVGFAESFRSAFTKGGGSIVAYEGVQKEARDYRTLITKLKNLDPDCVVLGATYDTGAPFVRQMKELDLDAQVLAGDGCFGSAFLEQAGNAAEATIVSFIAPSRETSPQTRAFFDRYEQKYGKVVSFAPLGYDAAKVVIDAIEHAGNPTRQRLISIMSDSQFIVDGVTGNISFKANGDNKYTNLNLYTVSNGDWVLLK